MKVGPIDDSFEREADRIADTVAKEGLVGAGWSAASSSGGAIQRNCTESGKEEEKIRRAPRDGAAQLTAEAGVVSPPDGSAVPDTPSRSETARAEAATGLLAEDDAEVTRGQMHKSEFLAELRAEVCATVSAGLSGTGRDAKGCPWIDHWFGHYEGRSSSQIERSLRRYAPEAGAATVARDYIQFVTTRVSRSVVTWARTGEITGMPDDVPANSMPGGEVLDSFGGMFFKARPGGPRHADPVSVHDQFGGGQPLPSGLRGRMESAFGASFVGVRLHTDATGSRLSDQLNARAFTVGQHVAFGAGEFRPGTITGDALIAHELAHVVQQGGAEAADPMAKSPEGAGRLEADADRSAVAAVSSLWAGTKASMGSVRAHAVPRIRTGLRLSRCGKSERQKEVERLGGLQYDFLEQQRKVEEDKKRKEAEEAAKKAGLPPPVTPPTVTVDDIIKKETRAAEPPKPADAWTNLDAKTKDDWKKRAAAAWTKVVASVAGTELEKVVKGKSLNFVPKEALELSYFGAQVGNKLNVGMMWVELAEKDPKNVWPNVAHELGGHFEYGKAYATEIMVETLEKLPEAERKKWKTDPTLRQKFFMVYEYAETEIFAELRERRYSKPEIGTAPPNPTDEPDVDVPFQLGELKKNLHPEVAKAVVADLKRRVDASRNILERDKNFFAEQIKIVFGAAP